MSDDLLRVTVGQGKYTVIQDKNGAVRALRYGEEWRDCVGDNLILTLAQEVAAMRGTVKLNKECYQCGKKTNWLAPDSRCPECTRFTSEEIGGQNGG